MALALEVLPTAFPTKTQGRPNINSCGVWPLESACRRWWSRLREGRKPTMPNDGGKVVLNGFILVFGCLRHVFSQSPHIPWWTPHFHPPRAPSSPSVSNVRPPFTPVPTPLPPDQRPPRRPFAAAAWATLCSPRPAAPKLLLKAA